MSTQMSLPIGEQDAFTYLDLDLCIVVETGG